MEQDELSEERDMRIEERRDRTILSLIFVSVIFAIVIILILYFP